MTGKHENGSPKNRKPGGQPGNSNNMRHGLRAGSLPGGARYIERDIRQFRKQVESAVLAQRGEIGVYQAALIQSSCRHEQRARLIHRWLHQAQEKSSSTTALRNGNSSASKTTSTGLSILDRVQLLRELSNASDSRDKCLERLKLDADPQTDAWAILDAQTDAGRDENGTDDR